MISSKLLRTYVAFEWFFARMRAFMILKHMLVSKTFITR